MVLFAATARPTAGGTREQVTGYLQAGIGRQPAPSVPASRHRFT